MRAKMTLDAMEVYRATDRADGVAYSASIHAMAASRSE